MKVVPLRELLAGLVYQGTNALTMVVASYIHHVTCLTVSVVSCLNNDED